MRNKPILIFLLILFLQNGHKTTKNNDVVKASDNKITSVEWSNYGGQMGYQEHIIVTKDSIVRTLLVAMTDHKVKKIKYKNSGQDWEKLITSINLKDFRKIRNGKSYQPFDGTDEKILIKTKISADSIINGFDDKINYPKIEKFVSLLNKIRAEKFSNQK